MALTKSPSRIRLPLPRKNRSSSVKSPAYENPAPRTIPPASTLPTSNSSADSGTLYSNHPDFKNPLKTFRILGKNLKNRLPPSVQSLGIALVGALLALFLYPRISPPPKPLTPRQVRQIIETHLKERPPDPTLANRAFQSIQRSLVLIRTKPVTPNPAPSPAPDTSKPSDKAIPDDAAALGTGFVVDESGSILTCFHVIAPGERSSLPFRRIGSRGRSDLCQSGERSGGTKTLRGTG